MASSPLDPASVSLRTDRVLGRGHGTGALDVQGAAGTVGK